MKKNKVKAPPWVTKNKSAISNYGIHLSTLRQRSTWRSFRSYSQWKGPTTRVSPIQSFNS